MKNRVRCVEPFLCGGRWLRFVSETAGFGTVDRHCYFCLLLRVLSAILSKRTPSVVVVVVSTMQEIGGSSRTQILDFSMKLQRTDDFDAGE